MHIRVLWGLAGGLLLCCAGYLTIGARGDMSFVLSFRGTKLIALLTVAAAISTATVLFQTITNNRILTPSIMGFDALYVLIVTLAVYVFGGFGVVDLSPMVAFLTASGLMIGASLLLFGTLLFDNRQDLFRMILTGVILGTLFRSLTSFVHRLMDPNEFAIIQVASYARFNDLETDTLAVSSCVTLLALFVVWMLRFELDAISLGRQTAIGLGVNVSRGYLTALFLIAVLVSVSTALVGPVAFLGLLVVAIAHLITPSPYHSIVLPSAALVSGITLVGGQTLVERVFRLTTPLSVIVDVIGGLVFLYLVLRSVRK